MKQRELRVLQSLGSRYARLSELLIKCLHQHRRGFILHRPQRGQGAPGAGLDGHTGQAQGGTVVSSRRVTRTQR